MIDFPRARETRSQDFNYIQVKIASPDEIRGWSFGEVTKPETINYRSFKPERDGLFCERIFGPVKDWECHCGKFKRIRFRGHVCDKCGVEVTLSKVRRERMGHIELAVPVAHIWMFKTLPSQMGYLLGMTLRDLEKVIYYATYVVTNVGAQDVKHSQVLDEDEFIALRAKAAEEGDADFAADIGADAVRNLLRQIDVDSLAESLRAQVATETSQHRKKMVLKRLKVIDAIRASGATPSERNRPEWMIMDVIPVIPPDLRPLVPLDGGRFATSDLNDLYRRVINRNNRLKKLMEMRAPEVILRNEKRMLQEAVDALFDNGRRSKAIRGRGKRPLKSLSDMLKGKQGRFRQNLLGKRVDYSGRSVIVVGPELKLHQCGLPKAMAVELFKPFIIHELEKRGEAETVKRAKKIVERDDPRVYEVLEDIIRDHPVLLNRAPTLHRLGIQAFEPVLVEGKAIRVHPLVCAAFNADFDGDQMAVHVPLSFEAQLEARVLMLSSNNILLPSNGRPIAAPSQDIVIGCYWLTKDREDSRLAFAADAEERAIPGAERDAGRLVRRFGNVAEVEMALAHNLVELHSPVYYLTDPRPDADLDEGEARKPVWIETTPGRVIFNSVVPGPMGFWNKTMGKKELGDVIFSAYRTVGLGRTVVFLDDLKAFGFRYATFGGVSVGIEDMKIPAEKDEILREADDDVARFTRAYNNGVISNGERYNKVIDTWTHANNDVADAMVARLAGDRAGFNPVFMMMNSGARGSRDQMRQLAGMRGLMAKPQKKLTGGIGEIIESPIKSNFREGLTVLEYFISTHGARKGLADTALKTADAGYLTRRLVDVAQDVTISEEDCGTVLGLEVSALKEGEDVVEPLKDRIVGFVAADDVFDPIDNEQLVEAGELITEEVADNIEDAGIQSVKIRNVLTCDSRRGLCRQCYGRNLATMGMVDLGEAVGILAAQSIGEPGTQLTLRTFHIGGTAARIAATTQRKSKVEGVAQFERITAVATPQGDRIVTSREGEIIMRTPEGTVRSRLAVPYGSTISVNDGDQIAIGDLLFAWDPYSEPIVADFGGTVRFIDISDEETVREELDESTGRRQLVIIEDRSKKLHPMIEIVDESGVKLREFIVPGGRAAHGARRRGDRPGRRAGQDRPRGVQDPRHHRRPAAHRRTVRGAQAQGPGGHHRGGRQRALRRHQARQARGDRDPGDGERAGVRGAGGQAPPGARGRLRARRRPPERGSGEPARHPADQGSAGRAGVPAQRGAGGLPPAGREDQRQAHRRDRAPDAAKGADHRAGLHGVPGGRDGGPHGVPGREPAGDGAGRGSGHLRAAAAGDHQGVADHAVVHLGGLLPGDHPGADRRRHPRRAGQPAGAEGEHHHRPPDPRRHRDLPVPGGGVRGRGRRSGGRPRARRGDGGGGRVGLGC
jgi:DNA-directed RNA polymerase subunit beta'